MPRRLRLAAPFIALALIVAGCGGSKVVVQEVPGGGVNYPVPGGGAELNPAATATATASATATPAATTTGASTGTTSTTQQSTSTTTGSTNGGTQAPSSSSATGAATATPAPGSSGQAFEDFCAQNPGAC